MKRWHLLKPILATITLPSHISCIESVLWKCRWNVSARVKCACPHYTHAEKCIAPTRQSFHCWRSLHLLGKRFSEKFYWGKIRWIKSRMQLQSSVSSSFLSVFLLILKKCQIQSKFIHCSSHTHTHCDWNPFVGWCFFLLLWAFIMYRITSVGGYMRPTKILWTRKV